MQTEACTIFNRCWSFTRTSMTSIVLLDLFIFEVFLGDILDVILLFFKGTSATSKKLDIAKYIKHLHR